MVGGVDARQHGVCVLCVYCVCVVVVLLSLSLSLLCSVLCSPSDITQTQSVNDRDSELALVAAKVECDLTLLGSFLSECGGGWCCVSCRVVSCRVV